MDSIREIINYLDGKKTVIGGIVAFLAYGALYTGVIDQPTFDSIEKINMLILGVGITHKVIKGAM